MKNKYKNSENRDKQWLDVESERFMIFMRPTSLTDFRKPWGKITWFEKSILSKGNNMQKSE